MSFFLTLVYDCGKMLLTASLLLVARNKLTERIHLMTTTVQDMKIKTFPSLFPIVSKKKCLYKPT